MERPIHTQVCGMLWTKLEVPSIGSMIHVGASVQFTVLPSAVDSSPMNLVQTKETQCKSDPRGYNYIYYQIIGGIVIAIIIIIIIIIISNYDSIIINTMSMITGVTWIVISITCVILMAKGSFRNKTERERGQRESERGQREREGRERERGQRERAQREREDRD